MQNQTHAQPLDDCPDWQGQLAQEHTSRRPLGRNAPADPSASTPTERLPLSQHTRVTLQTGRVLRQAWGCLTVELCDAAVRATEHAPARTTHKPRCKQSPTRAVLAATVQHGLCPVLSYMPATYIITAWTHNTTGVAKGHSITAVRCLTVCKAQCCTPHNTRNCVRLLLKEQSAKG